LIWLFRFCIKQKPLKKALFSQATALIQQGVSIRQAAKAIGYTALRNRIGLGKRSEKLGRFRNTFTPEQEKELVQLDKRFFGVTLKVIAVPYMEVCK